MFYLKPTNTGDMSRNHRKPSLKSRIKPGTTTYELDRFAEDYIRSEGGKPSFKGYQISGLSPFPSAICASVNSCIVHGIPSKKVTLKNGDIIGIDIGVFKNGFPCFHEE